ncbi:MAG: hypothetical protein M1404_08110 [Acidobacteria bacterium]|nr:hypothetical protein [Acidobacteriota bacterium]
MTLILNRASAYYVLQVTDRLVTRRTGEAFDHFANKNVLYICKDAAVAIGYTGAAYIDDLPTDVWIAERLTGLKLSSPGTAMRLGQCPARFHMHAAVQELAGELKRNLAGSDYPFQVSITGWKWGRKKRPAPTSIRITSRPRSSPKIDILPRHWHYRKVCFQASPGENLAGAAFKAAASGVANAKNFDEAEKFLAGTIEEVANSNRYVGRDCMSILLAPPNIRSFARVRFIPARQTIARFEPVGVTAPIAFSPWIILPTMILAPSIMVGGWTASSGPWRVRLEAPESNNNLLAALTSQKRPASP